MASIKHQRILVGIETDPTRYHGETPRRPAVLERAAAEQVLAHVAADLTAMLPAIVGCSLTMPGALYDQTQLIRPRYPVYDALETLQRTSNPGDEFLPRLLSIGASEGAMPLAPLEPFEDIPLGILLVLPLLISGPDELVTELGQEMEHMFLEKGQVTAHSAKGLEAQFGVTVKHARFMTLTDLNALLHLQMKHFDVLPLWQLLDAAIMENTPAFKVKASGGPVFKFREGAVHCFFESFDWWACHGDGADVSPAEGRLQEAYASWTHEYRRYQTMLSAHGIPLRQHLPGLEDAELEGSFLLEESVATLPMNSMPLTEHSTAELGTIAVTAVKGARQMNFYPLRAEGLNDIHSYIRDNGFAGDTAYPGRICYDGQQRRLVPEVSAD